MNAALTARASSSVRSSSRFSALTIPGAHPPDQLDELAYDCVGDRPAITGLAHDLAARTRALVMRLRWSCANPVQIALTR